jgi:hypothetical protein
MEGRKFRVASQITISYCIHKTNIFLRKKFDQYASLSKRLALVELALPAETDFYPKMSISALIHKTRVDF